MAQISNEAEPKQYKTGGWSAHYILIICTLLYMINYVDRQVFSAVLQPMKVELGLTDAQCGMAQTFFMLGMALGSWRALRRLGPERGDSSARQTGQMRLLGVLQLAAALSPLLLYGLFKAFAQASSGWQLLVISQVLFPTMAILAGFLGGYQFPLASRIYFSSASGRPGSPGTLYGLDLAGSCLGAVALSAYLVPVFGFLRTAAVVALVNLAPALLALLAGLESEAPRGRRPQAGVAHRTQWR